MVSPARVERPDGGSAGLLVLGPIGVRPDRQRRGIGGQLLRASIEAATRHGAPALALLGDPAWYGRFGFVPARDLGLEPELAWPDMAWQAIRLPRWTPDVQGRVRYPLAFGLHDAAGAAGSTARGPSS